MPTDTELDESLTEPFPPDAFIDAVYLKANVAHVEDALFRASLEVRCQAEELALLPEQSALPHTYREAYRAMLDVLAEATQAIQQRREKFAALTERIAPLTTLHAQPLTAEASKNPGLIDATREAIAAINAAESRLLDDMRQLEGAAKSTSLAECINAAQGLNYRFTVTLRCSPRRAFYQTAAYGDGQFFIETGPYSVFPDLAPDYNWNIYAHQPGHPLQGDQHGYLVHCLTDHDILPWPMIGFIESIDFEPTISNGLTLWQNPRYVYY